MIIMVSGVDMLKHWLQRNPEATLEQIKIVKEKFPRQKFFKVRVPDGELRRGAPWISQ